MSTVTNQAPTMVDLGREIIGDLDAGLRREWLVTNGLGGYASGTALGIPTRAYHGYLIAALNPPVDRTVLVSGLREWVDGVPLHAFELTDGSFEGNGHEPLVRLRLEGMLPAWTYVLGDGARVERRVWMEHGASTTYLRYALEGAGPADLVVEPLATARDHQHVDGPSGAPPVEAIVGGLRVRFEGRPAVTVRALGASVDVGGGRVGPFALREQAIRGEGDDTSAFTVGRLRLRLAPGAPVTLVLSTDDDADPDGEAALARALARQSVLIDRASARGASPFVRQLVLAADQFLVERAIPSGPGHAAERGGEQ